MDYAVLVGINLYPYPNTLNGCVNDVTDVENELVQALHFASDNIKKLVDSAATADAIKKALSKTVSFLKPGDRFLFWYSGHGAQLAEGDAATDVICPIDFAFTQETSVTVTDFHSIFSKIPDGVVAVWGSDSCHSGDLEKDFYRKGVPKLFRRDPKHALGRTSLKTFKRLKDISASLPCVSLISGCRSDQTSADALINNRYNGALTYYFIQALRQPNGLSKSLNSLVPEVQSALHTEGYEQIPQLSGRPSEVARIFLGQQKGN